MKTLKEQLEEFKLAQLSNKNNDKKDNPHYHHLTKILTTEQLEKIKLELDNCDCSFGYYGNNSHCERDVKCRSCSCCYDCTNCNTCYLCKHCVSCYNSNSSYHCNDCSYIDNCLFCDGIHGKYKQVSKRGRLIHCQDVLKYYVLNIKRTKSEYLKLLAQAKQEGLI